ncbi:MAG: hypothetical protein IPN29_18720 [Saprospiraceae bacterium]|nr:hypothetical protein [Saprospiraceae bacterium]
MDLLDLPFFFYTQIMTILVLAAVSADHKKGLQVLISFLFRKNIQQKQLTRGTVFISDLVDPAFHPRNKPHPT